MRDAFARMRVVVDRKQECTLRLDIHARTVSTRSTTITKISALYRLYAAKSLYIQNITRTTYHSGQKEPNYLNKAHRQKNLANMLLEIRRMSETPWTTLLLIQPKHDSTTKNQLRLWIRW